MDNTVAQGVWIAVGLMLAATILGVVMFLFNVVSTVGQYEQRHANAESLMQEMRMYNRFNNKVVSNQDVIATILEFKGNPTVAIVKATVGVTPAPTATLYNDQTHPNLYTLSSLNAAFPNQLQAWRALIVYDAGGGIEMIQFWYNS